MLPNTFNKDYLPGFIYLIDVILKDSKKTEENIYKEIAAWNSPTEKSRSFQAFYKAFNLRKYLKENITKGKKHSKPSLITLNILTSYYFEGGKPNHFKDFIEQYNDEIQAHYKKNKPSDTIINTLFKEKTSSTKLKNNPTINNNDISSKKKEKQNKKLKKKNRVLAILTLIIISYLLTTQFLLKRTVEITSYQSKDIIVFLNKNNTLEELGKLTKSNEYNIKAKLNSGKIELYYYSTEGIDGEEYPGSEIITILPFWKPMKPIVLSKI